MISLASRLEARLRLGWLSLCMTVWAGLCTPDLVLADKAHGLETFNRSVAPLLERYCADCHTTEASDGNWSFDSYENHQDRLADQSSWLKVQQLVTHHIMPPPGELAPSIEERQVIADWIEDVVFYVDPAHPDPGPVKLRRLNRTEYNNTVRDLLMIDSQPANQFPIDDSGYGFDNIADVLSISPLHYERYRSAARGITAQLTSLGPPPRVGVELDAEQLQVFAGDPELHGSRLWLRSFEDQFGTTVVFPVSSTYRLFIRAATINRSEERPLSMDVLCDGEPVAKVQPVSTFTGRPGAQGPAYTLLKIPQGTHRLALRLTPGSDQPELPEKLGTVGMMSVSGPCTPVAPSCSEFLVKSLGQPKLAYPILRLSGEDLGQGSGRTGLDTGRAWFATNGYRHTPILVEQAGLYRARFKVGAQQVGDQPARFEVRAGDRVLGRFEVTADSQSEQWIEADFELSAGEHDWQVWFVNEYRDPVTNAERWLWLHEFSLEGPLEAEPGISEATATKWLKDTARRLFRGELSERESERIDQLVEVAVAEGLAPQAALQVGLEALLTSPKFLFHRVPKPVGSVESGTAMIDELSLASRLSYFLWSSAPDEELLSLAERGALRNDVRNQIRRMLEDPKSAALTQNFAGQWLQLRNLAHVSPDHEAFPEFDASLMHAMRRETELVFEHVLHGNRSVLDFLDADYTFINQRLAAHYRLPPPADSGFVRVSLAGSPRRGVVTHGSVLTLTSLPTRTSPVKRGKWLLEQFLGIEPPPPPAEVPPLKTPSQNDAVSLREQLEAHRSDPACAACHALLDPYGLALENYDAIGRWRTREAGRPIDSSGRLISGETFSGWSQLQTKLIQNHRQAFVECFVEQLLTYALGRGVTYRDKPAIATIIGETRAADHRFQDLLVAICESVPFQRMRVSQTGR